MNNITFTIQRDGLPVDLAIDQMTDPEIDGLLSRMNLSPLADTVKVLAAWVRAYARNRP